MQGFLKSIKIPHVGPGVLASALCMDKIMTKYILLANNIPVVKFCQVTKYDYLLCKDKIFSNITKLKLPWFVKPANLGSSIGISKVFNVNRLHIALDTAFKYGQRVLVEESVTGVRELEIALIGNHNLQASLIGEVVHNGSFYDYNTKYTDGLMHFQIPANISDTLEARIIKTAIQSFKLLDCRGLARIDFFYQPTNDLLFLNEINTIPGFTRHSTFPKLWDKAGIPYCKLIEKSLI